MTINCQISFLFLVSKKVWGVESVGHENNLH